MTEKTCPRCGRTFKCNHDDIVHCQCSKVQLTFAAYYHIRREYSECLCGGCLRDINENHHPYAMYMHGFGSGAKSTSSAVVGARVSGYDWLHPEMPLDPFEALAKANEWAQTFRPEMIVGTSMGGMFTTMIDAPWAVKVVVNPAMEMDRSLHRIGYGKYDFFCEREDGVQQYVIDEPLVRLYEQFKNGHNVIPGVRNICIMSADDELLGHEITKKNAEMLTGCGFEIAYSDKFGHRLNEDTAKFIIKILKEKL